MTKYVGKLSWLFLALLGLVSAAPYLIIIDASYSMDDPLPNGQIKLEAAKEAAIDFVRSSQGNQFAIMKFHTCNDGGNPRTGDIRVVRDLTDNKESLKNAINSIKTGSYTPIAEAISEGRKYIGDELQGKGTIILITDGEENCGGDPILEAQKTFEKGIAVINVVSYAIDQKEETAIELHAKIAKAGGGEYYTAQNKEELNRILQEIQKQQEGGGFTCLPLPLIALSLLGAIVFLRNNQ